MIKLSEILSIRNFSANCSNIHQLIEQFSLSLSVTRKLIGFLYWVNSIHYSFCLSVCVHEFKVFLKFIIDTQCRSPTWVTPTRCRVSKKVLHQTERWYKKVQVNKTDCNLRRVIPRRNSHKISLPGQGVGSSNSLSQLHLSYLQNMWVTFRSESVLLQRSFFYTTVHLFRGQLTERALDRLSGKLAFSEVGHCRPRDRPSCLFTFTCWRFLLQTALYASVNKDRNCLSTEVTAIRSVDSFSGVPIFNLIVWPRDKGGPPSDEFVLR